MISWWNQFNFVYPWLLPLVLLPPLLYVWQRRRDRERNVSLRLPSTKSLDGADQLEKYRTPLSTTFESRRADAAARRPGPPAPGPERGISDRRRHRHRPLHGPIDEYGCPGFLPPNRLEVAKQVARDFVSRREFDRIGLVAYAGEAYTKSPLTVDRDIIDRFLTELQMGEITDGTAIGLGLETAINRLVESEAASKIIILLTDGENNAGDRHKPEVAAEIAAKFGIRVYTIGVGSGQETLMPSAPIGGGRYRFKADQGNGRRQAAFLHRRRDERPLFPRPRHGGTGVDLRLHRRVGKNGDRNNGF